MLTSNHCVPLLFPLIFLMFFDLSSPSLILSKLNSVLSDIWSVHAPVKTRTVPSTHISPWFTSDLHSLKSSGRKLERLYRKTGLHVHHQAFLEHPKNDKSALFCCSFLNYFLDKTAAVHQGFSNNAIKFSFEPNLSGHSLSCFSLTNLSSVTELISKSNSSTCRLDPAPTSLLKRCYSVISAPIAHLINASLVTAFAQSLKIAAVTPVLKKPNLDP